MYERHYSAYDYRDGRERVLFVGPGEKWVFRSAAADAVWVWRNFIDDCIDQRTGERQKGINCAVFRNESSHRSSDLIRQADAIADRLWPHSRHYTYVDPKKVASTNPGYCFLRAGWRKCGFTQSGLLILERTTMELTPLNPTEKSRTYTFPNGEKITLHDVTHFLARDSGTHRLQTADGKLHIVPVGWMHIEIDAGAFTV